MTASVMLPILQADIDLKHSVLDNTLLSNCYKIIMPVLFKSKLFVHQQ